MFEVNAKRAPACLRSHALTIVVPAFVFAGCVGQAEKFKSRQDTPDPGHSWRSSQHTADATTDTEQNSSVAPAPSNSDTHGSAGGTSRATSNSDEGVTSNQAAPLSATEETDTYSGQPGVSVPPGYVAPELVGVWQQARASSPDYANEFGETFSEVSSFSVQLQIDADGKYYFAHSTSGGAGACTEVSRFDESTGVATLDGNVLTLQPATRTIDISDCDHSYSDDTNLEPLVLTIRLSEGREAYGGMRTFVMSAQGFGFPLSLASLFREPTYVPDQPAQPDDFVLGVNGPFAKLQGQWVASATGTDRNFYDPDTGEFYFPEPSDSSQRWLRFEGRGYEAAVALQNVNNEGVCKLDLIYYERGSAAFAVLEDVEELGSHFVGHAAFVASDSRLIVNIRECDEKNRSVRYDLDPLTSYFRWVYFSPDRPPESFTLGCDFEKSEWQSLLCDDGTVGFIRPE